MNMLDNATIQTESDPWEQSNQGNVDGWPTAYPGDAVNTGAPTVVGNSVGGASSAPTVVGNPGGAPPVYNPQPGGQPQPYAQGPPPANYNAPMQPQQANYGAPMQPQVNYGAPMPQQQPYGGMPQPYGGVPQQQPMQPQQGFAQQGASGGASTVMMDVMRDTIPLAWLGIVEGPGAARGTMYALKRETLVGRAASDIELGMDPAVSTQHLKIRLEASETDPDQQVFVLYDMASANGVFVGDYEACKNEKADRVYRYELKDSDFLLVGQTVLIFKKV